MNRVTKSIIVGLPDGSQQELFTNKVLAAKDLTIKGSHKDMPVGIKNISITTSGITGIDGTDVFIPFIPEGDVLVAKNKKGDIVVTFKEGKIDVITPSDDTVVSLKLVENSNRVIDTNKE